MHPSDIWQLTLPLVSLARIKHLEAKIIQSEKEATTINSGQRYVELSKILYWASYTKETFRVGDFRLIEFEISNDPCLMVWLYFSIPLADVV